MKEFWKNLFKVSQNQSKDRLNRLKYAVFALGSTQYPSFCAFGKNIDNTLLQLGAEPILPIGLGDDLRGQELNFQNWGQKCYKNSCQTFGINMDNREVSETCFDDSPYDHKKTRITEVFAEINEQHLQHEFVSTSP